MRSRGSWILSLFAVAVLIIVGWTVYGQKQSATHKTMWEYKILGGVSEAQLNELGSEGWELVAVGVNNNGVAHYLKRAK